MKLRLFIVFFCTAGSVLLLQSAFDQSDHRKAEHAVQTYLINGQSLGAAIEKRAPGGAWSSEITNGCRGVVRVSYSTEKESFAFDCDLSAQKIFPASELARTVYAELAGQKGSP